MERAIIYYAKTGLELQNHFVPKLLEKLIVRIMELIGIVANSFT